MVTVLYVCDSNAIYQLRTNFAFFSPFRSISFFGWKFITLIRRLVQTCDCTKHTSFLKDNPKSGHIARKHTHTHISKFVIRFEIGHEIKRFISHLVGLPTDVFASWLKLRQCKFMEVIFRPLKMELRERDVYSESTKWTIGDHAIHVIIFYWMCFYHGVHCRQKSSPHKNEHAKRKKNQHNHHPSYRHH